MDGEDNIMEEIGLMYIDIYAKDLKIELHGEEQQRALTLITQMILEVERAFVDCLPNLDEIEKVVMHLPNNKTLGLDDITVEVLKKL